jgi:hypothetical protein
VAEVALKREEERQLVEKAVQDDLDALIDYQLVIADLILSTMSEDVAQ